MVIERPAEAADIEINFHANARTFQCQYAEQ